MPTFSQRSSSNFEIVYEDFQNLSKELVKYSDYILIKSSMNTELQREYFRTIKPTLEYSNSKHNTKIPELSMVVDIAPYSIVRKDKKYFSYIVNVVKGIVANNYIPMRWGGEGQGHTDLLQNILSS